MGLSVWQLKRQLAFLAARAVWAVTPADVIYTGGAIVSEDLDGNFAAGSFLLDGPLPATLSFARVSCRGFTLDPETPERVDLARMVLWSTAGGGWPFSNGQTGTAPPAVDSHGINMENASLRNAVTPLGKSDGRSVDELLMRFLDQLPDSQFVDSIHGFQGCGARGSTMATVNGVQVLKRSLEIDVFNARTSNFYHQPRRLAAVSGRASITITIVDNANCGGDGITIFCSNGVSGFFLGITLGLPRADATASADVIRGYLNANSPSSVLATNLGPVVTVTPVGSVTFTQNAILAPDSPAGAVTLVNNPATVTLSWTNPPARYDTLGIIVVRKAGSTAPTRADGTDGTVIATLASTATTYTDAPGTGTWSYGVFASYDEGRSPPATADNYSSPATVTITI